MDTVYVLLGWNDECQNGDCTSEVYGAFSERELAEEAGDDLIEKGLVEYYTIETPVLDECDW